MGEKQLDPTQLALQVTEVTSIVLKFDKEVENLEMASSMNFHGIQAKPNTRTRFIMSSNVEVGSAFIGRTYASNSCFLQTLILKLNKVL